MKLVAALNKTLTSDISDLITLKPHVKFLLIFHMVIIFLVSVLIGIIASPTFVSVVEMRPDSVLDTVPTPTEEPSEAPTATVAPSPAGVNYLDE